MRAAMLFAALICSASPVLAQSHDHGKLPEVTGGGKFPAGWQARRDNMAAGTELDNVKLIQMGAGLHATMGHTNAILWNPQNDAKGEFELTATFSQSKANPMHAEGYGLVFNGANLDRDNQSYVYFLVREGQYLINHRAGNEVHKIVPWTDHAAINKSDAAGKVSNALTVQVKGNDVNYIVNGQIVHQQKRDYLKPDGIVGLRMNMFQDMHVASFGLKPLTQ
jgi:hypothetical protein